MLDAAPSLPVPLPSQAPVPGCTGGSQRSQTPSWGRPRSAPLGSLHTPPGYGTLCQKTQGGCSRFVPFHRSPPERAAGDTPVSGAGSPVSVRPHRCVSVFMYRPATINRVFSKLRLFSKLRPSRPSSCARRGGRGAQAQSGAGLGRRAARCRCRRRRFRAEAAGRCRRHDDDDGAEQDLRAEAREVPAGGGRRVLHDRLRGATPRTAAWAGTGAGSGYRSRSGVGGGGCGSPGEQRPGSPGGSRLPGCGAGLCPAVRAAPGTRTGAVDEESGSSRRSPGGPFEPCAHW